MRIEGPFVPSGFNQASNTHSVQPGETLASVAKQYGVSTRELADANQIGVRKQLKAGMELSIPEKSGSNQPASVQTGIAGAKDRFENHKPAAADSLMQPAGAPMEIVSTKAKTAIETFGNMKSVPGHASIEEVREGNAKTAIEFSKANGDPITAPIEIVSKKAKTAIETFGNMKSVPGHASIEVREGNTKTAMEFSRANGDPITSPIEIVSKKAKTAIETFGNMKSVPGHASIEEVREGNAKTAMEFSRANGDPITSPIEIVSKKAKTAIETFGNMKSVPGHASIEEVREGNTKTAMEFSRANGDPITSAFEGVAKSNAKITIESQGGINGAPVNSPIELVNTDPTSTLKKKSGHKG